MQELTALGQVLQLFHRAAENLAERSLVIGATARDLILHHAHHLPIPRATVDLDIAVAVRSWEILGKLEDRLIRAGARRHAKVVHQFFIGDWKVDIVPFGKLERNGMIVWPDTENEMTVAGFDEASRDAIEVVLPGDVVTSVASPPGLLILKLIAWEERHVREPRHDAVDIRMLLDCYAGTWNQNRLYDEAGDLLEKFGYDNALAAAALLARDTASIARPSTMDRIRAIVTRATSDESLILARDMGGRVEENLALLEAVLAGFQDTALSRR